MGGSFLGASGAPESVLFFLSVVKVGPRYLDTR